MPGFIEKAKLSYNIMTNRLDFTPAYSITETYTGYTGGYKANVKTVVEPVLTRIAVDASTIAIQHVQLDEHGKFKETKDSELQKRFSLDANLDQTGPAFILDAVKTMLEEGACAMVPVDVSGNPMTTESYNIYEMRVGVITHWYGKYVEVDVYNQENGRRERKVLPKQFVAIPVNPFYGIMNKTNSTLSRLREKLALLDTMDNKSAGGKRLDMIVHLPFSLRAETNKKEAALRQAMLEEQLENSQYGVGYVGATDKITQLNRPVTNTIAEQVEYLTGELYKQLGLTPSIFDGTASEEEVLSYYNRTVSPIVEEVMGSMRTKFLTRTARSQGQDIRAFVNPFKMASVDVLANMADKLTRNAIVSSNDMRHVFGMPPVDTPEANELRNKNLNMADNQTENQSKSEATANDKSTKEE